MVSGQRVLVVDGLSETEQVLKAVLEPRGLHVDRVRSWPASPIPLGTGMERPTTSAPPHVVVLHEDEDVGRTGAWGEVPRVIIGSVEMPAPGEHRSPEYLPHPFQYRELISAIERLLARGASTDASPDVARSPRPCQPGFADHCTFAG